MMDLDSRGNRTFTTVTQATIKYYTSFPCVHEQWAARCGYDKLFNTKKLFFWFIIVICERLMVKCSHPGESGEISRELLLPSRSLCSSFSSVIGVFFLSQIRGNFDAFCDDQVRFKDARHAVQDLRKVRKVWAG